MKKDLTRIILTSCVSWGVGVQPSAGGLYNLAEPPPGPGITTKEIRAIPFSDFRGQLVEWIQLGNNQVSSPKRKQYEGRRHDLMTRMQSGQITLTEKIDLSAYFIRLKEYDKAIKLLTELAAQERDNFFVLANLITAHQLAGQWDRAVSYLAQIKGRGPTDWQALTKEQMDWFTRVEKVHYELVRERYRESQTQARGQKSAPAVDNLFGVRFVGDSGDYEAGKLAAVEQAKLPKDALAIVQQLLVWFPEDTRLYWLLGEVLNAQGNIADAATVLDECRDSRRFDAPDLLAHRRILREALAQPSALQPEGPAGSDAVTPSWFAEHRPIAIGGGIAGLVVIFLLFLQIQVIWRRLRSKHGNSKRL
jgi:tetratricopeptide (TPR) repeat protein